MKHDFGTELRRFSERMLKAGTSAGRMAGDIAHDAIREWARIWHGLLGENGHAGKPGAHPPREEVAARAYEIWKSKGCPQGTAEEDWEQAERQLAGK
jgi:hypothetical protein